MEGLEAGAVFHRGLACDDDAAGDVELLAHVLWYHPASDSAAQKHERLSLIEGLIAVGSAFGGGVEAVTMHKSKYVFVQVEAEVWMVWVFDATLDLHEHALASQMLQAYDGFALLHGGVSCVLDAGDGLEKFRTLAELRRKLRKASDKASRDYEGEAYVAEHAAIAAALSLEESNFDDPAKDCREELVRHFGRVWKRTDLSSADLGTDLCGIEQPHDSAAFLQLHRAQRAVKVHGVRGVSISYKGGLLWNGLDSSEFAQIHRYATARDREARAATPRRRHGKVLLGEDGRAFPGEEGLSCLVV
ncbi:hypothetical protein M885DRAFT_502893 [Pelagophyceae sp. CCMP2097]|nr:hypothetical protein M885DRAFT_502893 [Pelagophyceae sp. CCMP2097]